MKKQIRLSKEEIKEILKAHNLSFEDVARELNCSKQNISQGMERNGSIYNNIINFLKEKKYISEADEKMQVISVFFHKNRNNFLLTKEGLFLFGTTSIPLEDYERELLEELLKEEKEDKE